MTTPDKHESSENELDAYNYGIQQYELINIITKNPMRPFEAKAFIKEKGLVLLSNQGTMGGEPKIKEGNRFWTIPDTQVFFTIETFRELAAENPEIHCQVRKSLTGKPSAPMQAQMLTRNDIEAILRQKK